MPSEVDNPVIAVVGCGAIAKAFHVPALVRQPGLRERLVLVDRDPERARALADEHGIRETATDLDAVLQRLDGAVVAVPAAHHHAVASVLLAHGVAVLSEKPLCEEAGRARDLVEQARAAGRPLAVNQTRRLYPSTREIRDRLARGDLGRIRHIEFVLGEPFDWPAASDSYFGAKGGGRGVLMDNGAHVLDLVCWWLGGAPRLVDYRDDSFGGTEAVADLELEHAGGRAHVRLSWLSRLANGYRIECERGAFEAGIYEHSSYTLHEPGGRRRAVRTERRIRGAADAADALAANFVDAVRGRAEPLVPGHEVLPSLELIDACYASRRRFEMPWQDACERIAHGA